MKVLVFGSGAVGAYFGGRLAQAGEEVAFIARGEHLKALQENGLRLESIKGDFSLSPVRAVETAQEAGIADVILVAVKAWQVPDAASALKPAVGPGTFVVPLANGVEASDQISAVLGRDRVLGGLCRISSYLSAPGVIRHTAIEPFIAFGELDGKTSQRAEELRQAFERAGVSVQVPENIQRAIWEKFVFISALSGVGSVTRAPAGVLRSLPETRTLLQRAMQETAGLGRSFGVDLAADIVERTLSFVDGMAPHTTASMQRDVAEGRPSELESQTGAIVRLSRQEGLSVPVNELIYTILLPLEKKARGELQF